MAKSKTTATAEASGTTDGFPALNTTNANKFITDAKALPLEEREIIADEIRTNGIAKFVADHFTLSREQIRSISLAPPSALAVYTCEFAEGIENNWDLLEVKISDKFASSPGGGGSVFRCHNKGVDVTVSFPFGVSCTKHFSWE